MKKKYIIILIVFSIFLVGCDKKDTKLLDSGKKALESYDFDKAKSDLSAFLEAEPNNQTARNMYKQASKMSKATYYKETGNYNKALENVESIVNIDGGSQVIKTDAKNLKKELQNLQSRKEEEKNIRKENAKVAAKDAVDKSEKEFYIAEKNKQSQDENKENNSDSSDESAVEGFINTIKDKFEHIFN